MLVTLLVKTLTLEGSFDGIVYLFKPQWDKILEPSVWFAAVTQVFFSLNVYFANVIMYSSYNKFRHNIYRDANIVTTLDTFTSLLAGCCVFAVLGHLKHELGVEDIRDVMKGGPGVAFISYPETIAKFKNFSQFFSILFFFMLYVLGIGSNVAMTSCLVTEIKDHFHQVKNWQATLIVAIFGTIFGSIYYTQVRHLCQENHKTLFYIFLNFRVDSIFSIWLTTMEPRLLHSTWYFLSLSLSATSTE
jgi:solute carrier family 6 (neurotransmitter transporter, glycine) member 5/9